MNFLEFKEKFNIQLNPQQSEAVQSIEGPTLLLAVPGSGKTTVLVARLGYMLLCCGIDPDSILTLTYTRAATGDMSERFARVFGEELANKVEFRTINGICDKIIRYYAGIDGRQPFRLENDDKVINHLVSALYHQVENTFPTENDIKTTRTLITYIKNMRLGMDDMIALGQKNDIQIDKIYSGYQAYMRKNGMMDYDDQMVYAYNILKRSPETLNYLQKKYRYVCVDEAQDTSKIQHEIISLIAGRNGNLFMVGDEDQSIYGFRAAYPEALLDFEKNHPAAKVLLMEENFRSNENIVKAADGFINKNQFRHEKHMKSRRPAESEIKRLDVKGRRAQFTYLLKVANSCRENLDGNTAVLFRNNESAIPLIDMLEREDLSYRMQGRDLMFFTHRVVTDIRNIIVFSIDEYNTELFLQIYYKMNLFLNKKEAEDACRISNERAIPILEAVESYLGLTFKRRARIRDARKNLAAIPTEAADKAVIRILHSLEYSEYLERVGLSEEKADILRIIGANGIKSTELGLRLDWLKERIRTREEDPECNFILSTIHSSKGLEYDNVYLIDCADGIFPQDMSGSERNASDAEKDAFEEERRMFYVAITRARDNLILFDLPQGSSFINELLGEKPIEKKTSGSSSKAFSAAEFIAFKNRFRVGMDVEHKKFGTGKITDLDEHSIAIDFEDSGEKRFNLRILFEKNLM